MSEDELYRDREQTLGKHFILRKYLQRFAHIVGSFAQSITYVDCFSGPWKTQSADFTDTSFSIALEELRKARATLAKRNKELKIRCMFLEREQSRFAELQRFAVKIEDAEIATKNGDLEASIDDILQFVTGGRRGTFPFFFIDPTGWKGFRLSVIAPLLQCRPSEVLINFMTDYIRRFLNSPDKQTKEDFAALFGAASVQEKIRGLAEQDREDALIQEYRDNVKKAGKFDFTCAAAVLYPATDRSYFHLIYATRNRKGVEVFKQVEEDAVGVMERTRAQAQQRKRLKKTRQPELFSSEEMHESGRVEALRDRYLARAKERVLELLSERIRVSYQDVWGEALAFPLVWESDLKEWINAWKSTGVLKIEGWEPRQRVPKPENVLVFQKLKLP